MYIPAFFRQILSLSGKNRFYLLSLGLFLLSFCLVPALASAHAITQHGCAPDTPPPVAGTPVTAPAKPGSILINEVLNDPISTWNCSEPHGTHSPAYDSWIELINTQQQPLNLYAAHAEISLDDGINWLHLPAGSAIAPGGFLVLFPLIITQVAALPSTWNIILVIQGATIDQASIPTLQSDQSFARVPDGSSNWQLVGQPTIDASNTLSTVIPTPTKKPKPTKTPKPTTHANTDNTGSGNAGTPNTKETQPAWSQVQLPGNDDTTATGYSTGSSAGSTGNVPATSLSQNGLDSGHIVLIIVLIVLLAGALWYCWKLFHAP